jgi:hypothetical protein
MAGYLRRGGYDSPGSSGRSQINTSARTVAALAGLGNRTTQYESKFTWFVLMTALVAVRSCSSRLRTQHMVPIAVVSHIQAQVKGGVP